MPTFITTLKTVGLLLWNKGAAVIVLALLMLRYVTLNSDKPTPFAELLYAVVLGVSVIVFGPVIRLLLFPEAAEYAESGQLRKDLDHPVQVFNFDPANTRSTVTPPAMTHYRFATAISFAIALVCVASLV